MKIIHTDNLGRDYPDEKFVDFGGVSVRDEALIEICEILNRHCVGSDRFWHLVKDDYKLIGPFEP